jgi:hypothetical protein
LLLRARDAHLLAGSHACRLASPSVFCPPPHRVLPAAPCAAVEQLVVESYFAQQSTLPASGYFLGLNRTDQNNPYVYVTQQGVSQTPVNTLQYAHW